MRRRRAGGLGAHVCHARTRSAVCCWDSRPAMAWTVSSMCSRRPRWRASARQFFRWAIPGQVRGSARLRCPADTSALPRPVPGRIRGGGAGHRADSAGLATAFPDRDRFDRRERLVAAWFGPKGFASVVYGLLVLQVGIPQGEAAYTLIAVCIAFSIIAHSSTDVPIARLFDVDDLEAFLRTPQWNRRRGA